jgi:hypothetical protein
MTKYSTLYDRFNADQKLIADQKEEALYSFIGRYVIGFQSIEEHLEKVFHLAQGWDNWTETADELDKMNFFQKAELVHKTIKEHPTFIRGNKIEGWFDRVDECFAKIDNERLRRNSILHAQYIFEPIAVGGHIVQNVLVGGKNERRVQNIEFSPDYMSETLSTLANIALAIAFIRMQCVNLIEMK